MNNTTIFLALTTAHAQWSLRNRVQAFERSFSTGDNLTGFQSREGAIEAGKALFGDREFSVVRISFPHVLHEELAYKGQLTGTGSREGIPTWEVTREGAARLQPEADVVMEIIPSTRVAQSTTPPAHCFDGPVGPTGFGC